MPQRKIRGEVKTDPDRQLERGDILQETGHLAVRRFRVGQKRTARTRKIFRETVGLTPDDTYHGRQRSILIRREKIKRLTLERREEENLHSPAYPQTGAKTLSKKTIQVSEKI